MKTLLVFVGILGAGVLLGIGVNEMLKKKRQVQ
jgi:hypothetical protein